MTRVQELSKKLKDLNGLQWAKKQQLKLAVLLQASAQIRMHKNKVIGPVGHAGAVYVPLRAVQSFNNACRVISKLTKDLNRRKFDIRMAQNELGMILLAISKDAYFEFSDGFIHGIHACGFKGEQGEFHQEEIWGNQYRRNENGKLEMSGGSFRIFSLFDEAVEEYRKSTECKEIQKP